MLVALCDVDCLNKCAYDSRAMQRVTLRVRIDDRIRKLWSDSSNVTQWSKIPDGHGGQICSSTYVLNDFATSHKCTGVSQNHDSRGPDMRVLMYYSISPKICWQSPSFSTRLKKKSITKIL